ncbi:MAG: 4-vinyl reductase [Deltaproteobacteria bacterium]|uniref:4-vinyl reductase n=1 Tax=Candidatus Zymogenus saltonus TaxID=2844893 RepID=A0A9D8KGD7_9DELT|nr:4-vinyl reductase [Candidatus Zymogenus saltonus]
MTKANSLTHLAYRSVVDAIEDILGKNGKNSVLRFAGLGWMVENPVEYDPDARVAYDDVTRLYTGVREVIGNVGYDTIMYRGGIFTVKNILVNSEPMRKLVAMDFDPVEKMKLGYKAYITNAGYDPEKTMEHFAHKNEILIHRPDCTECEELLKDYKKLEKFTKPSCSFVKGLMQGIGNCFNEVTVSTDETKCRLVGDNECLFSIKYKIEG